MTHGNKAGLSKSVGHRRNARKNYYILTFGITDTIKHRLILTEAFMDQLDRCKDDDSRRILLGLGRPN